jgi:hypothetical protein
MGYTPLPSSLDSLGVFSNTAIQWLNVIMRSPVRPRSLRDRRYNILVAFARLAAQERIC